MPEIPVCCPECASAAVTLLDDFGMRSLADYFRCNTCGCVWTMAKTGAAAPRIVATARFGNPFTSIDTLDGETLETYFGRRLSESKQMKTNLCGRYEQVTIIVDGTMSLDQILGAWREAKDERRQA